MRFPRMFLLSAALLVALLSGCRQQIGGKGETTENPESVLSRLDTDLTYDARLWADSVLGSMSLESKCAQLFLPALYADADSYTISRLKKYAEAGIGGIVLLKGSSSGASAIADSLAAFSHIAPFVSIDAEWGLAMRLADAPRFPANGMISKEVGEDLMYEYGMELARECREVGINMVLGPVIDVDSEGGFIGSRSFGMDPERVSRLAIAYGRGVAAGNVLTVAKHFPGHGSVSTDSHRTKGIISRSLVALDTIDLRPFRSWIEQRLPGIMVGHLAVPSIDPDMLPAAVSGTVITDLLRNDLGFDGLVLTDALNMEGAEGYGPEMALKAGADMIVAPADTYAGINAVKSAIEEGRIDSERLDDAVRKILIHKYLYALPRQQREEPEETLASPEADSIALRLRDP